METREKSNTSVHKKTAEKHFLFLFSDTGGGHRSAVEAIIEAIGLEYGDRISTTMVDFYKEYTPWPQNRFPELYPYMVKYPQNWRLGYYLSNGRMRAEMIRSIEWATVRNSIRQLVTDNPSDLIVSVHAMASDMTLRAFETGDRPPLAVVVTDMVTTHSLWYHREADLTIVPTEAAFQRGILNKLARDRMKVIGLPVADRFCQPLGDRNALRAELGWPTDRPVIVIVGGGEGMGPLEQTAKAIATAGLDLSLVVITGRNEKLKKHLEAQKWAVPVFIYGFVHEMPDFMRAADVLVTKAGPGTISEALIAHLPIILYSYLPGQEKGNVEYLVEGGGGVYAEEPEAIVEVLHKWLTFPETYEAVKAACKAMARPNAAREIARALAQQAGL